MNPTQDRPGSIRRLLERAARLRPGRRVVVEGISMRPALEPGDRLVVVRGVRAGPGRVVALRDPRDGRVLVKRVGSVGPGGIEVRGDNAIASTDSRTFGPVSPAALLGVAVYRYAPPDRVGRLRPARPRAGDGPGRSPPG